MIVNNILHFYFFCFVIIPKLDSHKDKIVEIGVKIKFQIGLN